MYSEYLVSVFLWFLKYFLRWEQGYEVGVDPLCLIAVGKLFHQNFFLPSCFYALAVCLPPTQPCDLPLLPVSPISISPSRYTHSFTAIQDASPGTGWDGCVSLWHPHIQLLTGKTIFLYHLTEDLPVQHAAVRTWSQDVFFWFQLWNVGLMSFSFRN